MISFLYGESSEAEATDFSRHMSACAACSTEFALMKDTRESVSQWRAEVLGASWQTSPAPVVNFSPAMEAKHPVRVSALAALREFFTISPLWLRGATAMAVVLFCLLAAFVGTRFLRPSETLYTQSEVNAKVQEQLDQAKSESRIAPVAPEVVSNQQASDDKIQATEPSSFPVVPVKQKSARRSSGRFLSKEEREQLAADLRLQPTADDDDSTFLLEGGSN